MLLNSGFAANISFESRRACEMAHFEFPLAHDGRPYTPLRSVGAASPFRSDNLEIELDGAQMISSQLGSPSFSQ